MAKKKSAPRHDGRTVNDLRKVKIKKGIAPAATGSVLISMGNTQVICAVNIEDKVPGWMRAQGVEGGWLTAEYSMMPCSTSPRNRRETSRIGGRTMEIQRLIGRSLRASVDMQKLGSRTIMIDCDVLQADGGTRTASITGASIALRIAVKKLLKEKVLEEDPIVDPVAAISCGIVDGRAVLDLDYIEDVAAETDMNVVMTASGKLIEVQGTAEEGAYTRRQLNQMLDLAEQGIAELQELI